ncbi:MAG: PQQ-dependent sugar dehydrogenase [Planctomycetaceae bacterium]|nr:PQQ-dependent sugar dehydrogenase [Planctomycetaceae bacterium]
MRSHLIAACLICGLASPLLAQVPNTLSPSEVRSGWKLLFDGKTTNGWRNFKSDGITDGWVVENDELIRKEKGAKDILTVDQYDAFELLLEYKISDGGNSGLMFHVTEEANTPWQTGPEVQIQDNVNGHDPQKAGWLYQLYSPRPVPFTDQIPDATRPVGEWNQIYLRISPEQCEIDMNGVRYATFQKGNKDWDARVAESKFSKFPLFGKPTKGHICLQDHGNLVSFRNIKIRELKSGEPVPEPIDGTLPVGVEPAFPNVKWEGWSPEDEQGREQTFRPIYLTHAGDGSNRLFVAEQNGSIYSLPADPTATEAKRILDIRDRVKYSDRQNEEGLLGLAFHPQFKTNGQLFVYYTREDDAHTSVVSRFKADPKTGIADPASEQVLMTIDQPYWNHNGGTIAFGPDGYLYIALGDGGSGNDPHGNAQNVEVLLGSILRIDVDHHDEGLAYAIPKDNPFVNSPFANAEKARKEIYAYGVRNIWRMAFDRETGLLWAGDVGQNLWEEIDIITKGGNYGWNLREGHHVFGSVSSDDRMDLIEPVWEYDHQIGKSITGGTVYRGSKVPELIGKYLYADYVTGKIWALNYDTAAKKVLSNEAIPTDKLPVITFGEDESGEVYFGVVTNTGRGIYRFVRK